MVKEYPIFVKINDEQERDDKLRTPANKVCYCNYSCQQILSFSFFKVLYCVEIANGV